MATISFSASYGPVALSFVFCLLPVRACEILMAAFVGYFLAVVIVLYRLDHVAGIYTIFKEARGRPRLAI
jgi:hypothetical protein